MLPPSWKPKRRRRQAPHPRLCPCSSPSHLFGLQNAGLVCWGCGGPADAVGKDVCAGGAGGRYVCAARCWTLLATPLQGSGHQWNWGLLPWEGQLVRTTVRSHHRGPKEPASRAEQSRAQAGAGAGEAVLSPREPSKEGDWTRPDPTPTRPNRPGGQEGPGAQLGGSSCVACLLPAHPFISAAPSSLPFPSMCLWVRLGGFGEREGRGGVSVGSLDWTNFL